MSARSEMFFSAAVLALGILTGSYILGEGLVRSRTADRQVSVKGLSERDVKADLAIWPIRYVAVGNELAAVQSQILKSTQAVTKFLEAQGFAQEDFRMDTLQVQDLLASSYRSGPVEQRFILTQTVMVRSKDVERIATAVRATGDLVKADVILASDDGQARPNYIFTRLNDLKPEMLREATTRARQAAEEFARDSGAKVGAIRSASQGVFEILPAVELESATETHQIDKRVRLVSTITWLLGE